MRKPIHILQVTKSTGGVGRYIRSLVHGLDKDRFTLTVVCLSEGSKELAREFSEVPGVRAIDMQMDRYRINPMTDAQVWWKLTQIIRRGHFDIIHSHAAKPGFLARTAAIGSGIPVIYCPAAFPFHDGVAKRTASLYAVVERLTAEWLTEKIVTVCNEERLLAERYRVGRTDQFVNIYNGVDPAAFQRTPDRAATRASINVPDDAFLVGTVARLTNQKAPADFVHAAAVVHRLHPQVHFVWVGDGELESEMVSLVQRLGLEAVFHFAGLRPDVPDLLKVMDVFVLASHWEGFSISVLEAMASGLPVVMTNVSGAAEAVVDGETGFVVPVSDVEALAAAIGRLVSDLPQARAFGRAGRQRLEKYFTLGRMVKEVEDLYEEVVVHKNVREN